MNYRTKQILQTFAIIAASLLAAANAYTQSWCPKHYSDLLLRSEEAAVGFKDGKLTVMATIPDVRINGKTLSGAEAPVMGGSTNFSEYKYLMVPTKSVRALSPELSASFSEDSSYAVIDGIPFLKVALIDSSQGFKVSARGILRSAEGIANREDWNKVRGLHLLEREGSRKSLLTLNHIEAVHGFKDDRAREGRLVLRENLDRRRDLSNASDWEAREATSEIGELKFKFLDEKKSAVEITYMRTHPNFQRNGIGEALFGKLLEENPQVKEISTDLAVDNKTALLQSLFRSKDRLAKLPGYKPFQLPESMDERSLDMAFEQCCAEIPEDQIKGELEEAYRATPAYRIRSRYGFKNITDIARGKKFGWFHVVVKR